MTANLDPGAWIGRTVRVIVDRPIGSEHTDGGPTYPVNYGFVPGTRAGDGEEVDAYVLGPSAAVGNATGRVAAVIHRADDVEDKLVVVASGPDPTADEISATVAFQERFFDSTVLVGPVPPGDGLRRSTMPVPDPDAP